MPGTRTRSQPLLLLCFVFAAAVFPRPALPRPDDVRSAAELLAQGNASARAGKVTEALTSWKRAFERKFPQFRELAFRYPVEAAFLDRDGLRKKLLGMFEKEMPDEKIDAQKKALAAFGFFGAELDLKKVMLGVLTEEIAGFYDPDTKSLYLIREGGAEEQQKWWEKLLGTGMKAEEQRTVLIHEMSHALMDQHHDLLSMQQSVEHDDDMSMALSGLVEGEATVAMMAGEQGDRDLLRTPPRFMESTIGIMMPFLSFASGSSFRKAPRIVRESLIFPYMRGMIFCLSLTSPHDTWKPIDRAFGAPPISTEMLLHPEKYPDDVPMALSFPDLLPELGEPWKPVESNVLGEFQIEILLSEKLPQSRSQKAAAGWDGDLFRVYERKKPAEGGQPELLLAWATTWDSDREAGEFAGAMADFLAKRRGGERFDFSPGAGAAGWEWRFDGRAAAVWLRGSDVWVLDGAPDAGLARLVPRVMQLERKPKQFTLKRAQPSVEFPADRRIRAQRY